jgi:hypothetical protein
MSAKSPLVQGLIDKGATNLSIGEDIQLVSESDLASVAQDEAFMNEKVVVMILPTTNVNDPPYANLNVNGDRAIIYRNVPTVIRRKHLEVLARMKESRVFQDLTPNSQGEITLESLRQASGLAYPFHVVKDDNPKGGAWIANILAERA